MVFVVGGEEGSGRSGGAGREEDGEGAVADSEWVGEKGAAVPGARQELAVFPLLSWYHASWDDEPNLPPGDGWRALRL